ncbi:MAG TPA: hypothetical protein VL098_04895 [Flavipsychrobacter sp.]|nr:hypothetical protein [Flavipsychrobacter sp.]
MKTIFILVGCLMFGNEKTVQPFKKKENVRDIEKIFQYDLLYKSYQTDSMLLVIEERDRVIDLKMNKLEKQLAMLQKDLATGYHANNRNNQTN